MHLHDVRTLTDHLAPGCGDLDFSQLKPYVTEKTKLVVEAHRRSNDKEVQHSPAVLKKAGLA
jgi:sugar phosphate isomerase/epimerase